MITTLSQRVKIFLPCLIIGLACTQTATSANLSVTQFKVSVQVDSVCTVSMDWLAGVLSNADASVCADGTPVQIFVSRAMVSDTTQIEKVSLGNGKFVPDGGVESCGEETSSFSSDLAENGVAFPLFDTRQGSSRWLASLTVVSACF